MKQAGKQACDASQSTGGSRPTGRRWRRWGARLAVVLLVVFAAGEWFARAQLGLGDPPLSVTHPTIEYMFKPNQDVMRFGNRVKINAFGMRSDNVTPAKADPDSFRILVYGDSVINGGNLTDQSQVCTSLVQQGLSEQMDRAVFVGNVSAGSWGPPNMLAHLETFGDFEADAFVVVVSNHDVADVPSFDALNPGTHPTKRPFLALTEGFIRYFLPMVEKQLKGAGEEKGAEDPSYGEIQQFPEREAESLAAFEALVSAGLSEGRPVLVLLHPERPELEGQLEVAGLKRFAAVASSQGASVVWLDGRYRRALADGGTVYRDKIHPNAHGQKQIAEAILDWWSQHRQTQGVGGH